MAAAPFRWLRCVSDRERRCERRRRLTSGWRKRLQFEDALRRHQLVGTHSREDVRKMFESVDKDG